MHMVNDGKSTIMGTLGQLMAVKSHVDGARRGGGG